MAFDDMIDNEAEGELLYTNIALIFCPTSLQ